MAERSTALAISLDTGNDLGLYRHEVSRFPLLSRDEEQSLARRWRDHGDVQAAHKLVTSNLRFVIKIASEYRHYGFRLLDLVQEGNVGLMRAVHKFDPYKGFRLITYAVWWIRAHIHDFILRSWSLVRVGTTRVQRRLFNRLQSAQKRLKGLLRSGEADGADSANALRTLAESEDDHDQALAAEFEVDVGDVQEFRRRVQVPDLYLEESAHEDGVATLKDALVDQAIGQEQALEERQIRRQLSKRLSAAVEALPDREREVVTARLLSAPPRTLAEIGKELGVSKERVRQIERRAKERLREALADCELSF